MLAETDWDEEHIQVLALLAAVLDDLKRFDESAKVVGRRAGDPAPLPAGGERGARSRNCSVRGG